MRWYDIPLNQIPILDVLEGCADSILDMMGLMTDQQKKEVAAYRQKKCDVCPQYDDGQCVMGEDKKFVKHEVTGEMVTGCGCFMRCKKFIPNAECPALKWKSIKVV